MKRNVEMMEIQIDDTHKKERIQSVVAMPSLMLLQSKSYKAYKSIDSLAQPMGDTPLQLVNRNYNSSSNVSQLLDTVQGSISILLFFNPIVSREWLQWFNDHYYKITTHYRAHIIGVTAYTAESEWNFPVINDDKAKIASHFSLADPCGGGAYPLNALIVFSPTGTNALQLHMPAVHNVAYRDRWKDATNIQQSVVGCLDYLASSPLI
ncbi:BA75_02912T0 [Komagataella pastoris]|uniref:BA75_02912T0 n=1 Tax=Komagataella pastoris TaxID=4922 RepID=A0A1B2JD86_PICPA|nr:BA75_02912T0 [Komagataella pastoris]